MGRTAGTLIKGDVLQTPAMNKRPGPHEVIVMIVQCLGRAHGKTLATIVEPWWTSVSHQEVNTNPSQTRLAHVHCAAILGNLLLRPFRSQGLINPPYPRYDMRKALSHQSRVNKSYPSMDQDAEKHCTLFECVSSTHIA
ncbi:hypothetical protein, variant [Exophiala sideris]|uniref:Uncharacterized protein n=1 Tax=Exophiala sideris TaxID=1016849 RepID=A0A0D1XBG7_9EURO|nr:hypothetical protein PV11_00972 [Exophiala sideris]KIV85251.1 hypothetical protein, variant [Exophiala sideris]